MNIKEIKSKTLYKEYILDIPYSEVDILINNLIKNHLGESGIPKGLRADFKTGFKIVEYGSHNYAKWTHAVWRSQILVNTDDKAFSTN